MSDEGGGMRGTYQYVHGQQLWVTQRGLPVD